MMSRPQFEHVGLTVGDLDRMVAFFTEMLGFELKARLQPIDPGAVAGIIGVGNKTDNYNEEDVKVVTQLADISWDITERKQVEERIRQSEERFREIRAQFEEFLPRLGIHDVTFIPLSALNGDNVVNGADLGQLLGNWAGSGLGDLNNDGVVNGADLGQMLGAWGTCP